MSPEELKKHRFTLASKSPRRQQLLHGIGIAFTQKTKDVDESFPEDLHGEEIPLYLARKKADAFENEPDEHSILITADTIVWINDHVLNKPANEEEARLMLIELSGNRHEVFTGVSLKTKNKEVAFAVRSGVYFKDINNSAIGNYIRACRPFDKAGAYGAQECLPEGMNPCSEEEMHFLRETGNDDLIAKSIVHHHGKKYFSFIEKIDGSYFNVMGLPVMELWKELDSFLK